MTKDAVFEQCRKNAERFAIRYAVAREALEDKGLKQRMELCIAVDEEVTHRSRWNVQGSSVDAFIIGKERLAEAIGRGMDHHIVALCAAGDYAFGNRQLAEATINLAKARIAAPAPPPSKAALFRFQYQPHDLLSSFEELRTRDRGDAGVVIATLVNVVIEAYMSVHRLWRIDPVRPLLAIAEFNPSAADSIRRVIETPLDKLCREPHAVRDMVRICVTEAATKFGSAKEVHGDTRAKDYVPATIGSGNKSRVSSAGDAIASYQKLLVSPESTAVLLA